LTVLREGIQPHMRRARRVAREIEVGITFLDPVMTRYCEATCPSCNDPCCGGRAVFFNRADLLFQLALGMEPPPGQTRTRPGDPCRYLGPGGCALSRTRRPYVCVWFLCEPQMELFSLERPAFQRELIRALENLRALRIELDGFCSASPPVAM